MPPLNTFEKTAIALLLSQAAIVPATNAATINVGVGGADCTLSDAIRSANQDIVVGSCIAGSSGADTINIPTQTITFGSAAMDGYAFGDSALPLVESIITIEGNGSTLERVSADPFRLIATKVSSNAVLTLNSITLSNGYAEYLTASYGGAVYAAENTTITINNSTINDSSSYYGGAVYGYGSTIRINNSTITGNTAAFGGGVWVNSEVDMVITESVVSGNSANGGGGIYVYDGSIATLINTTVSNNTAVNYGGGISVHYGGDSTARLDVLSSTISDNTVSGVTVGAQKGGGIIAYRAEVNIINSTISGNHANASGSGLYVNATTLTMKNATVSDNSTVRSIGFSGNASYPTSATFLNTVVANSPGNLDCFIQGVDVTLNVDSSNWIESDTCNSPSSGDPMLGPLTDHGGLTYTHNPAMGSGLEGAGALSVCGSSPVAGRDQRGEPRGTDSCFIGAVEPFADGSINFFVVPVPGGKSVIFGL